VIWDEEGIAGSERFLQRVWRICQGAVEQRAEQADGQAAAEGTLHRATHKTIRRVTDDVEAFKFNTALAAMMEWVNVLNAHLERHGPTPAFQEATGILIRLLAPFTPHIADELWSRRGGDSSVHQQPWPAYDPALTTDETVTLVVQVNGKVRDRIAVPAGIPDDEARCLALASPRVQLSLAGRLPRQVIVVPGRLVNIVV